MIIKVKVVITRVIRVMGSIIILIVEEVMCIVPIKVYIIQEVIRSIKELEVLIILVYAIQLLVRPIVLVVECIRPKFNTILEVIRMKQVVISIRHIKQVVIIRMKQVVISIIRIKQVVIRRIKQVVIIRIRPIPIRRIKQGVIRIRPTLILKVSGQFIFQLPNIRFFPKLSLMGRTQRICPRIPKGYIQFNIRLHSSL